jgi:hypothetical protein
MPATISHSVDFPEPLGPVTAIDSPVTSEKEMPSKILAGPKDFDMDCAVTVIAEFSMGSSIHNESCQIVELSNILNAGIGVSPCRPSIYAVFNILQAARARRMPRLIPPAAAEVNPAGGDKKSPGLLVDEPFFLQIFENRAKTRTRECRVYLDFVQGNESALPRADKNVMENVKFSVFHGKFPANDGTMASSGRAAVKEIIVEAVRQLTIYDARGRHPGQF